MKQGSILTTTGVQYGCVVQIRLESRTLLAYVCVRDKCQPIYVKYLVGPLSTGAIIPAEREPQFLGHYPAPVSIRFVVAAP